MTTRSPAARSSASNRPSRSGYARSPSSRPRLDELQTLSTPYASEYNHTTTRSCPTGPPRPTAYTRPTKSHPRHRRDSDTHDRVRHDTSQQVRHRHPACAVNSATSASAGPTPDPRHPAVQDGSDVSATSAMPVSTAAASLPRTRSKADTSRGRRGHAEPRPWPGHHRHRSSRTGPPPRSPPATGCHRAWVYKLKARYEAEGESRVRARSDDQDLPGRPLQPRWST